MLCRVLVVDRRRLFALGLVRLLATRETVVEAQALLERSSLPAVLRSPWQVVVTDAPGSEDVLRLVEPATRVIVLLDDEDAVTAARLLGLGASGICVPTDSGQDVAEAVERVSAGEMRLPAHLVGAVLEELVRAGDRADRADAVLSALTGREREVLSLLGRGLGRAEVARQLALSPNTVRTHVQHLLKKLSLHSQLEAAAYARELMSEARALPAPREPKDADNVLDLDAHARRSDGRH